MSRTPTEDPSRAGSRARAAAVAATAAARQPPHRGSSRSSSPWSSPCRRLVDRRDRRSASPAPFAVACGGRLRAPAVRRALPFYGPFVEVYERVVAPALVGLRSPAWFALGVAIALGIALAPLRPAAVAGIAALGVALVLWVDTNWTTLYDNFHETTWSPTLLSLLPFACVLAVGLRVPGARRGARRLDRLLHPPRRRPAATQTAASGSPSRPRLRPRPLLLTSLGLLVPRLRPARAPAPPPASTPP